MPYINVLKSGYEFPEITSWIRASKKDFELVKDIGTEGNRNSGKLFRLSYFL